MKFKKLPTQYELRQLFDYDPNTGALTWAIDKGKVKMGQPAGWIALGYRCVRIDGVEYRAHRLIWMWVHGRDPVEQIDHINSDRADNRLVNLRECSHADNTRHGFTGRGAGIGRTGSRVSPWQAFITFRGKFRNLGRYATKAEARTARAAAERQYWGLEKAGTPPNSGDAILFPENAPPPFLTAETGAAANRTFHRTSSWGQAGYYL